MPEHAPQKSPVTHRQPPRAPDGARPAGPLQLAADSSMVVRTLAATQSAAAAHVARQAPIQRKPFVVNNTGERIDIGPNAMNLRALSDFTAGLEDEVALTAATNEIKRRNALLPDGGEFKAGMFSGTYVSDMDRNWADLHVVGALGGSMDPADLKTIFTNLKRDMSAHYAVSGVMGTLEWHPTGAVVTKQIVELLGEALGGWKEWFNARSAKSDRKKADARGDKPKRDKMAGKLAPELVPEHMAYLRSLKGAAGLEIAVGGGMPLPDGIRDLPVNEQLAALNQSMVDGSVAGDARLAQYEAVLSDDENPVGPSMRIKLAHTQLGKLIGKLP